jgi:hypothetical protein
VIANPIMRKLYCSVDGASSGGFFGGVEGIRGAGGGSRPNHFVAFFLHYLYFHLAFVKSDKHISK